jgi:hypothetical protein
MNMREGGLTPDIPLGPFEGTLIPAYAATKAGRLHARPDCPRLRADHVSELKMPLNAVSFERICAECARWGRWALPGTALGMYLEVVSGYGLPYQLDSYTEPDLDDFVTDKEIAVAAALLHRGEYPSSEAIGDGEEESDEGEWDTSRTAQELRDSRIVPQWCSAVESLMDAAGTVARYPWLGPWAGNRLDLKSKYAEVLRQQAGDLPSSLFAPQLSAQMTANADEDNDDFSTSVWDDRYLPSEHPEFGEHLGGAAGERKLRWMHHGEDDIRLLERSFRIFTLGRGVHDLRTLDPESYSGVPAVPRDVWLALLLVRDHLNLRPFWQSATDDARNSGLGLPLSVLADLQIYTTNADPRIAGKGHSPFCQHAQDSGVRHDDFLLTLEEVMRRSDLDWCSICGGYALRRLSDEQISYYRVAHRLLDIHQALTRELDGQHGSQQVDLTGTSAAFDEISQWLHGNHQRWQDGDTWRVQDVLRELKNKADRLAQYRRDGWPDSGSVVGLKPRP